jgi:O-antigen/teichoic acid export membrane protein
MTEIDSQVDDSAVHRKHRHKRIVLAWTTSMVSKVTNVAVLLLAVPLVYRALGQGGYAAYAAITASAGLIAALNLGIGGSLVTPIAEASSSSDTRQEALLVQAGLAPLVGLCLLGAVVAIPAVSIMSLRTLYGNAGTLPSADLRMAALIAVAATLATVPVSAITFLRQAYQEMHVSNLIGAGSNLLLCIGLVLAARHSTSITPFVSIFLLIPLAANVFNFGRLLLERPYLLHSTGMRIWHESRHLLGDGLRFLGASFSSVLLYQWPVYWIARSMPTSTSSWFAICMQLVLLPLASILGLLQPLWPSTADAIARSDHGWLRNSRRKWRLTVVATGGAGFLVLSVFGQGILHAWLRKPLALDWQTRTLMGAYLFLAIWEYYNFALALGFGRLREAGGAVFQRSVAFAAAVPLLTATGDIRLLWGGMCCSILFWTAWRLPKLLRLPVGQTVAA